MFMFSIYLNKDGLTLPWHICMPVAMSHTRTLVAGFSLTAHSQPWKYSLII